MQRAIGLTTSFVISLVTGHWWVFVLSAFCWYVVSKSEEADRAAQRARLRYLEGHSVQAR